jgi:transcription elongation factor Elf1
MNRIECKHCGEKKRTTISKHRKFHFTVVCVNCGKTSEYEKKVKLQLEEIKPEFIEEEVW